VKALAVAVWLAVAPGPRDAAADAGVLAAEAGAGRSADAKSAVAVKGDGGPEAVSRADRDERTRALAPDDRDAGAGAAASDDRGEETGALPPDVGDAGAGAALTVDEFAPVSSPVADPASSIEAFATGGAGPVTKVFGSVRGVVGVDTRFESAPGDPDAEDVTMFLGRANLGVDVKLSDAVRVVAEGRLRWHAAAQRGLARARAEFEPTLGDAYVDLYTRALDLRVGNQVVAFGANAAFAPADALNPRDLRDGLLSGEPEDGKLPAFAVRALGDVGKVTVTAAYFPFFTPNRYSVFGQDGALLQPGLGLSVPQQRLDRSIAEYLQPHLLETKRPADFGWLGDLGLRFVTPAGPVKLGASWVWANEKLPQVRLDPELSSALNASARGKDVDTATALSLQNRLAAGEQLYTGTYGRQHLFSVEASMLAGPAQLDVDVSYSPAQTFVDAALAPVSKEAVTWVVGVSQAEDSPYVYSLTYLGMAVPGVNAQELLFLLEPSTAQGAARTAFLHLLVGAAGAKVWGDRVELSVRAAFEPIQRSFALAPRVQYVGWTGAKLWLGAEFYEGPALSPLGYYRRNSQVLAGAQLDLF
jgi:hypothetical protein